MSTTRKLLLDLISLATHLTILGLFALLLVKVAQWNAIALDKLMSLHIRNPLSVNLSLGILFMGALLVLVGMLVKKKEE